MRSTSARRFVAHAWMSSGLIKPLRTKGSLLAAAELLRSDDGTLCPVSPAIVLRHRSKYSVLKKTTHANLGMEIDAAGEAA